MRKSSPNMQTRKMLIGQCPSSATEECHAKASRIRPTSRDHKKRNYVPRPTLLRVHVAAGARVKVQLITAVAADGVIVTVQPAS